jgi:hypothetical protein
MYKLNGITAATATATAGNEQFKSLQADSVNLSSTRTTTTKQQHGMS